jgi:hypothetical protein
MAAVSGGSGALTGVRMARVRHVARAQRTQGRSVFSGTCPIADPAQANLRPDVPVLNDGKVWGPDPWRPPPV